MLGRWREILERTVTELDREIAALSESKDALEQALEAKNLPTDVNVENLVTREGRRDIDVVDDEVDDQLQKVGKCHVITIGFSLCEPLWHSAVYNLARDTGTGESQRP